MREIVEIVWGTSCEYLSRTKRQSHTHCEHFAHSNNAEWSSARSRRDKKATRPNESRPTEGEKKLPAARVQVTEER